MKTKITCAVVAAFLCTINSLPALVSAPQVFDSLTDSYFNTEPGYTESYEEYGVSSGAPGLTADFSSLGETTLALTWAAPEGFLFDIYVPTGMGWEDFDFFALRGKVGYGANSGSEISPSGTLVIEGNAAAEVLSGATSAVLTQGSASAQFQIPLELGTRYLISSITYNITVPASYDATFAEAPLIVFGTDLNTYIFKYSDSPSDVGAIMTLTAVPEPATTAALIGAFALAGTFLYRRRSL